MIDNTSLYTDRHVSVAITAAVNSGQADNILWNLRKSGLSDLTAISCVLAEALASVANKNMPSRHRVDL